MRWEDVNRNQWAKVRTQVLERDGYRCRIQLPGCTGKATQVDHIIRLADGGKAYDPNNLRAACWNCNRQRPVPPPTMHTHPERW